MKKRAKSSVSKHSKSDLKGKKGGQRKRSKKDFVLDNWFKDSLNPNTFI